MLLLSFNILKKVVDIISGTMKRWGLDHAHRVIVWTIYLNDVPPEYGGETEFLDQCRRVPPTTGTVVMW